MQSLLGDIVSSWPTGRYRPHVRYLTSTLSTCTILLSSAAIAQTSASQGPQLQEIVVTGSLIKRTDTETPAPVQVITAQDLQDSGYTEVSDVLRNLAANGSGTLNQGFGQAFAAGGTGIALRGLSVGDTLTLIDSERMVSYPLSDDGERSFVDVSSIPSMPSIPSKCSRTAHRPCTAPTPLPAWSTSN